MPTSTRDRSKELERSPIERVRALHLAGDVRAARALAWSIENDATASEADRAEARAYRERTEVDPRTLRIGLGAAALAVFVIVYLLVR